MQESLVGRVVVPIASTADAEATANAVNAHLDSDEATLVLVHVIEKSTGAPDKASVEQREAYAHEIFAAFAETIEGDGLLIETRIRYGTNVANTILETATELDASAVVFTPRGGNRWLKMVTGDVTWSMLAQGDQLIVALPECTGGGNKADG